MALSKNRVKAPQSSGRHPSGQVAENARDYGCLSAADRGPLAPEELTGVQWRRVRNPGAHPAEAVRNGRASGDVTSRPGGRFDRARACARPK
jgi:hypothetical protein